VGGVRDHWKKISSGRRPPGVRPEKVFIFSGGKGEGRKVRWTTTVAISEGDNLTWCRGKQKMTKVRKVESCYRRGWRRPHPIVKIRKTIQYVKEPARLHQE